MKIKGKMIYSILALALIINMFLATNVSAMEVVESLKIATEENVHKEVEDIRQDRNFCEEDQGIMDGTSAAEIVENVPWDVSGLEESVVEEDGNIEGSIYGSGGTSFATATELRLGVNMANGEEVNTTTSRYYKITLEKAAYIEVNYRISGYSFVDRMVYDKSGFVISSLSHNSNGEGTLRLYLHKGTYYLVFKKNKPSYDNFKMNVVNLITRMDYSESFPDYPDHEDDIVSKANTIKLDKKYSGFLGLKYEADNNYYKIKLNKGVKYIFKLNGECNPILYNSDLKIIQYINNYYNSVIIPETGEYYLKYYYSTDINREYKGPYEFMIYRADGLKEGVLYRYHRPDGKDWLITCNFDEISELVQAGWIFDGAVGTVGDWGKGTEVVRFYNKYTNDRMYSNNAAEIKNYENASVYGWVKEGPAFYTSSTAKSQVIRYATPDGVHIWSIDRAEQKNFDAAGWMREGEAFRVD